jgi:DNA gyrase subunit A
LSGLQRIAESDDDEGDEVDDESADGTVGGVATQEDEGGEPENV